MITVTLDKVNGAEFTNDIRAIHASDIVPGSMRPLTANNTATAAVFKIKSQDSNGNPTVEEWQITETYAATLTAISNDAATAGAELASNKATDFSAPNDTTYPTTDAVEDSFQPIWYAANTGTDTYAITLTGVVPAAYYAGMTFRTIFANANTGAATIAVNGLAAKTIAKGVSTALAANDIVVGKVYELRYDGTRFQVDVADVNKENTANKATTFGTINDTLFPSVEAVVEVAQPIWFFTATGTDTYAATLTGIVPTAYYAGMMVKLIFGITNTGAATINLNGLGAKAITKGTDGVTALSASDLVITKVYTLVYDGTRFQVTNL